MEWYLRKDVKAVKDSNEIRKSNALIDAHGSP